MTENDLIVVDVKVTVDNIENKAYVCNEPSCGQQFSSEKSIKKHLIMIHHSLIIKQEKSAKISYRFNCPIATCRRSLKMDKEYFTSRKHLHQHYFKVHNSQKFDCTNTDCDKKFSTELLRNLHQRSCGKIFTCHCNCCFNSKEALQTHQRRKHPLMVAQRKDKIRKNNSIRKRPDMSPPTRTISTTTAGLGLWNSIENLPTAATNTSSVFTSTDQPVSSTSCESKSTTTSDATMMLTIPKLIKNSSTSTADDFTKEENSNSLSSSSSQTNKKNINWSGDFDDSINLFDSDVKMEFYTAETQTDFSENLFNNNYTQTTFTDLYDFEKFDIQTQTNWDEWRRPE